MNLLKQMLYSVIALTICQPTLSYANDSLLTREESQVYTGFRCEHKSSQPQSVSIVKVLELKSLGTKDNLGLPLFNLVQTTSRFNHGKLVDEKSTVLFIDVLCSQKFLF